MLDEDNNINVQIKVREFPRKIILEINSWLNDVIDSFDESDKEATSEIIREVEEVGMTISMVKHWLEHPECRKNIKDNFKTDSECENQDSLTK
jgi:hypothetical protein